MYLLRHSRQLLLLREHKHKIMAIIFNPFDGQLAQHPDYSAEFAKLDSLYFLPTPTKTGPSTYSANIGEEVRCNTITTGSFTVTLPVAGDSDSIKIVDVIGVSATTGFGANALTVSPQVGDTIMGNSDLVIDVGATKLVLMYNDSDSDWKIVDIDSPQFTNLEWSSILGKPTYGTTSSIDLNLTGTIDNYVVEGDLVDNGVELNHLSSVIQASLTIANETIIIPLSPYGVNAYAYTDQPLLGKYFPNNLILSSVSLTLEEEPTGSAFVVDIKKNGSSIFSSLLTVADGQTGSSTYNFNSTSIVFETGDLITFSVTQPGTTTPGKYPVLTIEGIRGEAQSIVVPLSPLDVEAVATTDQPLLGRSFPFDFQIDEIILTLDEAPTGSAFEIDIKLGTTDQIESIFGTKLTVDNGETSSTTANTAYTLVTNPTIFTKGDLVTFSITQPGTTTPGRYPVVAMIGREV
jgi:hypothetical protein